MGSGVHHGLALEGLSDVMRAAILLSAFFLICGVAAFFGVSSVQFDGQPIVGIRGFVTALLASAAPPVVVLGWRKMSRK
jgi:hypothetical protein